jgi:hypothetical protein
VVAVQVVELGDASRGYQVMCTHNIQWFEKVFLPYFDEWEKSVKGRDGYDDTQKKRMLLIEQTMLGLRMTGK